MRYFLFFYSIVLLFSTFFGYKKGIGGSINSIINCLCLFIVSSVNLFGGSYLSKLFVSILLVLLSVNYFFDRKKTGNKIHYEHHFIRLIFHLIIILGVFFEL